MKDFVNKITLQGIVGAISVDLRCFSLAVEDTINVYWFVCIANNALPIKKGDWVRVEGKIQINNYHTEPSHNPVQVIVNKVEKL